MTLQRGGIAGVSALFSCKALVISLALFTHGTASLNVPTAKRVHPREDFQGEDEYTKLIESIGNADYTDIEPEPAPEVEIPFCYARQDRTKDILHWSVGVGMDVIDHGRFQDRLRSRCSSAQAFKTTTNTDGADKPLPKDTWTADFEADSSCSEQNIADTLMELVHADKSLQVTCELTDVPYSRKAKPKAKRSATTHQPPKNKLLRRQDNTTLPFPPDTPYLDPTWCSSYNETAPSAQQERSFYIEFRKSVVDGTKFLSAFRARCPDIEWGFVTTQTSILPQDQPLDTWSARLGTRGLCEDSKMQEVLEGLLYPGMVLNTTCFPVGPVGDGVVEETLPACDANAVVTPLATPTPAAVEWPMLEPIVV